MTKKDITAIALKFFALFIVIELLNTFVFYGFGIIYVIYSWFFGASSEPPTLSNGHAAILSLIGIFAVVLPILMAFILWRLANRLVDDAKLNAIHEDDTKRFPREEVILIMIVGIGLWVTIMSIPDVANSTMRAITEFRLNSTGLENKVTGATLIMLLSSIVKLVLGVSLIIGRKGWSALLFKLRYAGS